MKITVVGTGYVGLVTAVCFAEIGNTVVGFDKDNNKIQKLKEGISPIYEPGIDDLLKNNLTSKRLSFSSDITNSVKDADFIFIAVGTPPNEDGSADLSHVLNVAHDIGLNIIKDCIVINKSTVPVGTADSVQKIIEQKLKERKLNINIDVVSNPEFLKEGHAIFDFMSPSRVIVGTKNIITFNLIKELYRPFVKKQDRILNLDRKSAELSKYVANSMLALRISFMNEVAMLCDELGADFEMVRQGIGSDPRIGQSFLYAGCGYGGSCFPKDVRSLINQSKDTLKILNAVHDVNEFQKNYISDIIDKNFPNNTELNIAVWGLSFKPKTDDIREAPSINTINYLLKRNFKIKVYDPAAMRNFKNLYKNNNNIFYMRDAESCLDESDILIIHTEWPEFQSFNLNLFAEKLRYKFVIDGRNIYNPLMMKKHNINYHSVGRNNIESK